MNKINLTLVASILVLFSNGAVLREGNQYFPKAFDLSMIPESRNCDFKAPSEGMCTGGNWAQIFSQALHLSQCIQSFQAFETLSGEQLLQCVPDFGQDRCSFTIDDLKFVDTIGQFIKAKGLASQNCLPFQQYLTGHLRQPSCPSQCADGSPIMSLYPASLRQVKTEQEIKTQLGSNGPAIIALRYSSSFNQYLSGEFNVSLDLIDLEDEVEFGIRFLLVTGWKTNARGETIWKAINSFGEQWANQGKIDLHANNPYIMATYVMDLSH